MPVSQNKILSKIVATVGPATRDVDVLVRLIEEGARVFRINFSHGSMDDFKAALDGIRAAEERVGIPIGVLGDLSGPKIRVGKVENPGVELQIGQTVRFQKTTIVASANNGDDDPVFSATYPRFVNEVQPGQRVLINDGAIRMLAVDRVRENGEDQLLCTVTHGGLVTSAKGINLPETDISAPALTEHDKRCATWAAEHELDFLALSFVRSSRDVHALKQFLHYDTPQERRKLNIKRLPIISKIEKPQALEDLDAILRETDGVMIARGDLGVEMELSAVPAAQKRIIKLAHDYGKPVVVATQMLQTMIDEPMPTRAEASDVANAIFDGADAVMLSGETAVGKYPALTVATMRQIAEAAEDYRREHNLGWYAPPCRLQENRYRTAALAHGVNVVAKDLGAKLVINWSETGGGARYLSQNRMSIPIIAASSNRAALRRMTMMFGVRPQPMQRPQNVNAWLEEMDKLILEKGWARRGDPTVVVKGDPLGVPGVTNKMRIHYVGDAEGH